MHASLNINTETGRLSARRPNLQNQPALSKDIYGVRRCFRAEEGKQYVVADYGQLELRLLAHMAGCKSMLEAFRAGGDFHSRTAMDMYDHIKEAVDMGNALLEWEKESEPPAPLVKSEFASERKKAKTLNFSIAYGKTAHGLAKDFGTETKEAEEIVNRWYASRSEVREWQWRQQQLAEEKGKVYTLLGRQRNLPDAKKNAGNGARNHALRAAINTPIQGGAADIVSLAMLNMRERIQGKFGGWKILLQVHDEVILEGPQQTAKEVEQEVKDCMARPFKEGRDFNLNRVVAPEEAEYRNLLDVELEVDSKIGNNWMECK